MKISKNHPRYESLIAREKIVKGVKNGITSLAGLAAHGRGEAFDYFLGEKTTREAKKKIYEACKLLFEAEYPVISVNGNVAALVCEDIVKLAKITHAKIEVNIFHTSRQREKKIKKWLIKNKAKEVLLPEKTSKIKYITSNRKYVNKNGIKKADVVFVPLEDGDRTEALIKNGKKVIVIDLNPMSRSAKKATITIVDNITRSLPLIVKTARKIKNKKI